MKVRLTESELIDLLEEVLLVEAMSLKDVYAKYYSEGKPQHIPEEIFYNIAEADPTRVGDGKGKYTEWLISLYRAGKLKTEDLYKATQYLEAFHKFKNRIEQKDIRTYKSLPELYRVVKPFIDNPDQATSKSDEIRRIKEGAERVYEDDEWLVIVPHTRDAAIYYGKGTQWCTAATASNNFFDYYNKDGRLYININKQTGDKYQFHFESEQFMYATDDHIESPVGETIGLTPRLIEFYKNKYGKLALPVTSEYDPEDIDTIKGLDDYSIYYPDPTGEQSCLIRYNDELKDYEVIDTLRTPNLYFYGVCLNNRFVCIRSGGTLVNLYDIVNKTLVFSKDDNIFYIDENIDENKYLDEDVDTSKIDYVVCCVIIGADKSIRIYSLKEMRFVLTVSDEYHNIKPLTVLDKHYKSNLFYALDSYHEYKGTVFDAERGVICDHVYLNPMRRYYDGRTKRFNILWVSNSPYMDHNGEKNVLLYDGSIISWDEFEEHEQEILGRYA